MQRMLMYGLVFMVCVGPGLVDRIVQLFSIGNQPLGALTLADAILCPAQGALNAIVYGFNRHLLSQYTGACNRFILCNKPPDAVLSDASDDYSYGPIDDDESGSNAHGGGDTSEEYERIVVG